jgi:microsomal epoxide hydrolase
MAEPPDADSIEYTDMEKAGIQRRRDFLKYGHAYAQEHATRPSTIGLVLSSNPLALLAWIGEKYGVWTDETPPLEAIIESVSLYWLAESYPTSIYHYRERFASEDHGAHDSDANYIKIPLGYSFFPKEVAPIPKAWVEKTGNLVWYRGHTKGGHFAAMEQPELLLEDVESFVKEVWKE